VADRGNAKRHQLLRGQGGGKKGLVVLLTLTSVTCADNTAATSYDQRVKKSDSAFGSGGLAASI